MSRAENLGRFAVALRREAHHLVERPELLWQQMYNRLQWTGGEMADLLRGAVALRGRAGGRPWLRARTRFVESEALRRTLRVPSHVFAASPDGSFVVSAVGQDLVIQDLGTGAPRARLRGHADTIHACDLSPRGDRIVSGSADGALKLWDVESGSEVVSFEGHSSAVQCCTFGPDGSSIVSAGGRGADWREFHEMERRAGARGLTAERRSWLETRRDDLQRHALLATAVMIWNAETGGRIATMTGHRDPVLACAVTPDGSAVVTASGKAATIWDLSSRSPRTMLAGHQGLVTDCAISADGRRVVTASMDETLKIWDAESGREQLTLRGHAFGVNACAITADGALVVSGSTDGTIKLWDAATGRESRTLRGHGGWVTDCALSPDGSLLFSLSGQDGTFKIWDLENLGSDSEPAEPTRAGACAIRADADTVVASCDEGEIEILRPDTGERARLRSGSRSVPSACPFSPDGRFFVAHGAVFDGATAEKRFDLRDYDGYVTAIAADGSYVVSASRDKKLRIWDSATGEMLRELQGHASAVITLDLSPDGTFIVSAGGDKSLRVWSPRTGRSRTLLDAHGSQIVTCAVSPDASFLVTSAREVKVWEVKPLRERFTLSRDEHGIFACAISPAGDLIAAGGPRGTLRFWDAANGEEKAACRGSGGHHAVCAFTPDGAFLVSAGGDGRLRVWRVADGLEVATLPLPAALRGEEGSGLPSSRLALSPRQPRIACVDSKHNLHVVDLEGFAYGPRIVTAHRRGWRRSIRCPGCGSVRSIDRAELGTVRRCAREACGIDLRVNPFTIRDPALWRRRFPWAPGRYTDPLGR